MQPERLPLAKVFDVPFLSLDGTSVEMASLLFLFLAVIVIASLGRLGRRRQSVRRVVQGVALAVFAFVVYSCLGVFGMIRNGLYGVTLLGSAYTEAFYWMALPAVVIGSTILTGPLFCGWICPTGTLQELAGWLRKRLAPGRVDPARRPRLRLVLLGSLLALFLGLGLTVGVRQELFLEDSSIHWAAALLLLCWLVLAGVIDDLPTRRIRLVSVLAILVTAVSHQIITSPMHFAFTARDDPASALATLVIILSSLFVLRGFCRYLCPWGYVMGFLHRFSRLRIVRDTALCKPCDVCARACDVSAISDGAIRREHCQFCLACVDACPNAALSVEDGWQVDAARLRRRPERP